MKKEQNQLKEAFVAFYNIQSTLDEGIEYTFKLDKVDLTVVLYGPSVVLDNKWCIDAGDIDWKPKCQLSTWVYKNFNFDIYDCIDYKALNKQLKIFDADLKGLEKLYPAKSEHVELFVDSFWETFRWKSDNKLSLESRFKKFEKLYNEAVAAEIQRAETRKQKEKAQTNPEEFVSINGVLVSKEEIKKLAAKL